MIVLNHTGASEARDIAERLRRSAHKLLHHPGGEEGPAGYGPASAKDIFRVTLSTGIAIARPVLDGLASLDRSDQATPAKPGGRNLVVINESKAGQSDRQGSTPDRGTCRLIFES